MEKEGPSSPPLDHYSSDIPAEELRRRAFKAGYGGMTTRRKEGHRGDGARGMSGNQDEVSTVNIYNYRPSCQPPLLGRSFLLSRSASLSLIIDIETITPRL